MRALLYLLFIFIGLLASNIFAQPRTYCNPINIDYAYNAIPDFVVQGKHRTTADPLIVLFRDKQNVPGTCVNIMLGDNLKPKD